MPVGLTVEPDSSNYSLDMAWSVPYDNRQAIAYEIQQIQGHLITGSDNDRFQWRSMGTIISQPRGEDGVTEYTNQTLPRWHTPRRFYRVVPIGMDGRRAEAEQYSSNTMFPSHGGAASRYDHHDIGNTMPVSLMGFHD